MLYAYSIKGQNTEYHGTTEDRQSIVDHLGLEVFAKGRDWKPEDAKAKISAFIQRAEDEPRKVVKDMVKQYADEPTEHCQPYYAISIAILHP